MAKKEAIPQSDLLTYASYGEQGAGELFARVMKDRFRAEKSARADGKYSNKWYVFEGQTWKRDVLESAMQEVHALAVLFLDEASKIIRSEEGNTKAGQDKIRELQTAAQRFSKNSFRVNALLMSAYGNGENSLALDPAQWDQKRKLIPCSNGILDPRRCTYDEDGRIILEGKRAFRELRTDDYVRLFCTDFDPEATCPNWRAFLDDSLDGHTQQGKEVIDFLQVLGGYSLLGSPSEDVFVMLDSAHGRSGKGVFSKLFSMAAGGFAQTAKSGLFLKKTGNDPNKPDPALMALRNKRVVFMSEQAQGDVYDSALVKTLTSGRDSVVARGLYGEETNFNVTFTFWQSTNELPRVSADDEAFWARLVRIKFPYHYTDNLELLSNPRNKRKDSHLEEKLIEELSGILNWFIIGAIKYLANDSRLPEQPTLIRQAGDEYRRKQDSLADFIETCCVVGERYECKASSLYQAYAKWSEDTGRRKMKDANLKEALLRRGFSWRRSKVSRMFTGLSLQETEWSS